MFSQSIRGSYARAQRSASLRGSTVRRTAVPKPLGLTLAPGRSYSLGGPLGRVFVEARIAQTTETAVYAIRSRAMGGGPLALKIFDLSRCPRSIISQTFALQRRCQHPLVVTALSLHFRANMAYLVMERPLGPCLQDALTAPLNRQRGGSMALLLRQFALMAQGVQACHDRGVVHRDVKPSNFVLTGALRHSVKLTDFALASDRPKTHGAGTTCYMAPEALQGAPSRPSQDVWALGISLFTMVVGIEPHYDDNEALTAALILAGQPAFTCDDLELYLLRHTRNTAVVRGVIALYLAATRSIASQRPTAALLAQQAARLAAFA